MRPLAAVLAAALLFFGGFIYFIDDIARLPATPDRPGDLIVVLTGGSVRVAAGIDLLAKGIAPRLFISGVHPGTNKSALAALTGHGALYDCCVDLGFEAADTTGNALEIGQWIADHPARTVIVVTANYHLPRALIELARFLPGVTLVPVGVRPDRVHLDRWWTSPGTAGLLLGEYGKYLAARLRASTIRLIKEA